MFRRQLLCVITETSSTLLDPVSNSVSNNRQRSVLRNRTIVSLSTKRQFPGYENENSCDKCVHMDNYTADGRSISMSRSDCVGTAVSETDETACRG